MLEHISKWFRIPSGRGDLYNRLPIGVYEERRRITTQFGTRRNPVQRDKFTDRRQRVIVPALGYDRREGFTRRRADRDDS